MLTTQIEIVLRIRDERVVLRLEPAEVVEPLQRRLRPAREIERLDQRKQRAVERTLLDLVLLRVEVLLGPGCTATFSNDSKPE